MQAIRRTRDQTGGASSEPVTLEELKTHLRIDHDTDDTELSQFIIAATDHTEKVIGRCLVAKTIDCYMDAFPSGFRPIILPWAPLVSVTSIKYYDNDDTLQTWSDTEYTVDSNQEYNGLVYPGSDYDYPSPRVYPKSVIIEYIAGYADTGGNDSADRIPQSLKIAVMMLAGHLYENREATAVIPGGALVAELPMAYQALTANFKIQGF